MATLQYKSSLGRYRRYLQAMQNQPLLKASLFLILSLVLVIILIVAALRPTLTTIAALLGQIKAERLLEQRLDAKIHSLQEAQQQLAVASSRLVYLDEAIPPAASLSVWSNSLQRLASESGVTVASISLSDVPVARVDQAVALPFKIAATGEYGQLYRFLQSLQSLRRLIKLETVGVARTTKEPAPIQLDIVGALQSSP